VTVDVVVVGAGPAGLSAAVELRRLGVGSVLVADRETAPGGVPRHSFHTGYGLRDRHRIMTGPAYARTLAAAARAAGAELRLGTTVTGLDPGPGGTHAVTMTSARGVETVTAAAVLLATGCRERPRAARLIPGDRPPGVMTTGELQQRAYLGHERLPGRALVVGAEHVSFSAAVTLAHAGARDCLRGRRRRAPGRRRGTGMGGGAGAGARGAAAALDLAERDRVSRPSPARPVPAAQRSLPSARPAGGQAGRPAADPVTPGPDGAGPAGAP